MCIKPTLQESILNFLGPIIIANVTLKLLNHFIKSWLFKQITTTFIGISLILYHFYDNYNLFVIHTIYTIGFSLATQLCHRKIVIWMICISSILVNELAVLFIPSLVRLRPHIMIMVMKTISFYDNYKFKTKHEDDDDEHENNDFFAAISYLLHPLSTLLGVWHPFKPDALNQNKQFVVISKSIYYLAISLFCILLSNCIIQSYIEDYLLNILRNYLYWFVPKSTIDFLDICFYVYLTALQFRVSHYFVCLSTQSMLTFWEFKYEEF